MNEAELRPVYKQLDYLAQEMTKLEAELAEQIDPRTFGQLEGAVKSLTEKVGTLATDVEGMRTELRALTGVLAEAKGGWRVVMLLGGAGAALGGAITWALQHIKVSP